MQTHTSRIIKGKRTYFFDVKQTKTGEKYLVITESWLIQTDTPPKVNGVNGRGLSPGCWPGPNRF